MDVFYSFPTETLVLNATEARIKAIYKAARIGLRGDTLALAAGMRPQEYRRLIQFHPEAELAEMKGHADGEAEMAAVLRKSALGGDAKAALDVLKHKHGWVAKQHVEIQVDDRISILKALEMANARVDALASTAPAVQIAVQSVIEGIAISHAEP